MNVVAMACWGWGGRRGEFGEVEVERVGGG